VISEFFSAILGRACGTALLAHTLHRKPLRCLIILYPECFPT
jgi:hypothetical protein